jgi:ribulose 1,5-bisphosphate synthetase/thiazole synthase
MTAMDYKRSIPLLEEYDVAVVGSGPSGVCAAVAAARSGVKTCILERYGILGGNMTSGHVGPFMGKTSEGTYAAEINRIAGSPLPIGQRAHDFERLKSFLPSWVAASGVKIFLQTQMIDVVMDSNRIKNLVAASPEGIFALSAKIVVDATGDGLTAFLAGAPYEKGREGDKLVQPVSVMFTLSGIDEESVAVDYAQDYSDRFKGKAGGEFRDICKIASAAGLLPASASFVRLYKTRRGGERVINATHKNCIDGTKTDDIAAAELELRDQIIHIVDFLRGNIQGFTSSYVSGSASTLGVRESRRIIGDYILTEDDLCQGRKFDDVVVHDAQFILDIHGIKSGGQDRDTQVNPYDIPYRCLLPQKTDNLITVGRCISGTHVAHSSYRVMNIVMPIGQAGGTAAALSVHHGCKPRNLDVKLLQKKLQEMGVRLFN